MDALVDHLGRPLARHGMGFVPSAPTYAPAPLAPDATAETRAVGFLVEREDEENENDDDEEIGIYDDPRHKEIHARDAHGQAPEGREVKGDPRPATELARLIRTLAARIHDEETLDAVARAVPADKRASFKRSIAPLLKFKLAAPSL